MSKRVIGNRVISNRNEAMRIMDALEGVDEELLERCENSGSRAGKTRAASGKRDGYRRQYWARCAAVLALIAVGAVSYRGLQVSRQLEDNMSGGGSDGVSGVAVTDTLSGSEENFMERGEMEPEAAAENAPGTAGSAVTQGVDSTLDDFQGSSVNVPNSYGEEGASNGGQGASNTGQGAANKDSLGADRNVETQSVRGDEPMVAEGCKQEAPSQKLKEAEAREVETLGSYVPTKLPEGYTFESASYYAEEGKLSLCWVRGMDSIMLFIRQVKEGETVQTVDAARPETYDERLYEIPHAETVPEEYRQTINSPVFAKDDFSLEIVCSRVLSYGMDSGDTSTPRGNFSVLYDGVLVRFSGRGTPEQIWEMFDSIEE